MKPINITLVSPGTKNLQFGPIKHLPLAILSLAAWVREFSGCIGNINIVDTQIRDPEATDFLNTDIVGISAMTGQQIKTGLEVSDFAKKTNPDTVLIWGGIHPSLLPSQTAKHDLIDGVVVGEGEATFCEIAAALSEGRTLEGIPGTCVQTENGIIFGDDRPLINMEEMPLPAYDLIDMALYEGIEQQFDYQSSRGCPFRCGFCYNTVFCKRKYRKKSSGKVLKELFFLKEKYSVETFGFVDDEFFIDKKRAEKIFEGIIENGQVGISASCRLDLIRKFPPSLFEKMKNAGVSRIFFGAESGSDFILKRIKKDITTEDILAGSRITAESKIRPFLSFMSGFPGEGIDDFKETLNIILKLWELHPLITVNGIFPFNPYPGTALYEKACELGLSPPDSLDGWGQWTFQYEPDSPWLDPQMKKWMEIAFYIVRFKYYLVRYQDRHRGALKVFLLKILVSPLNISANLRMKHKWFGYAWEWRLFAGIVRKSFGFL